MHREREPRRANRQDGFSLIGAIFLLVVMAAVGSLMVSITGVQRRTTSLGILGARAYHAASSGIQWGLYQALSTGTCPAATTLSLTQGGVSGFSVGVTCTSSQHQENGTVMTVFTVAANAEYGTLGDADYARRLLRGTATDAP